MTACCCCLSHLTVCRQSCGVLTALGCSGVSTSAHVRHLWQPEGLACECRKRCTVAESGSTSPGRCSNSAAEPIGQSWPLFLQQTRGLCCSRIAAERQLGSSGFCQIAAEAQPYRAMPALPAAANPPAAQSCDSSRQLSPRSACSLAPASWLVVLLGPTPLLDTACRARHADGPPSVYPFELTALSHSDYESKCYRRVPGYQGHLTSMEAELQMERLGFKWQSPPRSIWCSGDKVYCLQE